MAESRRVPFTTLPCNTPKITVVNKPNLPPQTVMCASTSTARLQGNGHPSKQPPNPEPTVRYVLTLFEPDELSFPEFDYAELQEKKSGPMLVKNGTPTGTFVEEQNTEKNEVEALARTFEDKYGSGSNRKKDRIQDLVDIGFGYDDDDSFIDNTEAYDEFVPASLTTKFGGFYVNSGVLQFRQASDKESDDFTTEGTTPSSPKKRKLKEGGQDKPKKKKRKEVVQMDSNTGALSENGAEEQMKKKKKKKKKPPGVLSITDMLKKFQREKEREKLKEERQASKKVQETRPTVNSPRFHLCPADAAGGAGIGLVGMGLAGMGLADPLLSLIGSTNENTFIQAASTVDFDIDLDSLLDAANENSSEVETNGDPSGIQEPTQRANQNQKLKQNQNQQPQTENQGGIPQPKPLLPTASEAALTLPAQPKTDTQTQSAAVSQAQSQPPSKTKASVQQPQLTQILSEPKTVSLLQLVPLPEGLPLVLQRRIGELTVTAKGSEGESKLKFFTPEINSILLDIELQCRQLGVQVRSKVYTHLSSFLPCSTHALLIRVKRLLKAHVTQEPVQKLEEAIGRVMPEQIARYHDNSQAHAQAKTSKVTEEGKEREQKGNAGSEGEEKSGKGVRRKTFKWNEETRACLYRVVRLKMDRYETERSESQDMEEYLKIFLDNEVKPLWPKGWMQPRVLLKESRRVFNIPGSLTVKKTAKAEKTLSGAPTPPSGSSDAPTSQRTPPQTQALSLDKTSRLGEGLARIPPLPAAAEKELGALKMGEAADKHSPLNLLAEQALARERLLQDSTSRDLFAAALDSVTGDHSRHWSLEADFDSPPPPPPPPQSSPVGPPGNRPCHLAGSSVLQAIGLSGLRNGTEMLTTSNDTDATVYGASYHRLAHNGVLVLGDRQSSPKKLPNV